MAFQQAEDVGFNRKALKKSSRRVGFRRLRIALLAIAVWLGASYLFMDYLARLPRERSARYLGFLERVELGRQKAVNAVWLGLEAWHEDPKNTKLPIVEVYIKGKRLDNLTENLPDSGREYQKGKVKLEDKVYKADLRFRGDSINHWAFPQKSWRIRLSKDKDYKGHRFINLNVPRMDTQISNWIGYEIARKMGVKLVPEVEYVHFRLNRQYDGVRMMLEQPNQDFLSNRNLPLGKLYIGDIGTEEIYGNVVRKKLYSDPTAWVVKAPTEAEELDRQEIEHLIRVVRNEHHPYRFYDQINSLIDIDDLLKYMAMLEVVSSVHIDETHNNKFYFNPISSKLVPIVWDTVAYHWYNKGLDLASNNLFRVILSNPEYRERKDRYLWKAVTRDVPAGELLKMVDQMASKIRSDIYAFPLKIYAYDQGLVHLSNSEWEKALVDVKNNIEERNSWIEKELQQSVASYKLLNANVSDLVAIEISARSGVQLDRIVLQYPKTAEGQTITLKRRGVEDVLGEVDSRNSVLNAVVKNGRAVFNIDDQLYSKRRIKKREIEIVPATYVYQLSSATGVSAQKVLKLKASNSVTGGAVKIAEKPEIEIAAEHRPNSVWWLPSKFRKTPELNWSGRQVVKQDLILPAGSQVTVQPGSEIVLAEGVSIVLDGGSFKASGSSERPISIRGQDSDRWGAIVVRNNSKLELDHVSISGGTHYQGKYVRYNAPISIFGSEAKITNAMLNESAVLLWDSRLSLESVSSTGISSEGFESHNSIVRKKDYKYSRKEPFHSLELLNQKGVGTPPRAEREFKFSLVGGELDRYTLSELSEEISNALHQSSVSGGVWSAPQRVGNSYYVDRLYKDFAFRDIYYDTDDHLNYHAQVSYRYRNRYKGYGSYKKHVRSPQLPEYWPHRLEFQAKVDRREIGGGFSTVQESRFEFRKESAPFSEENLPPGAPWDVDRFMTYFEAGAYEGVPTLPAVELMKYLNSRFKIKNDLRFRPELVLVTERYRQHLNIKTPWGSGPNPEQAFIITLDRSHVYDAAPYLSFLRAKKLGVKKVAQPAELGALTEIEIEFERNVSDKLDREIESARSSNNRDGLTRLTAARDAFLEDQSRILEVVGSSLKEKGIKVEPASKSKYAQSFEMKKTPLPH